MNVWVRVIGFSPDERHAIQTLLHLSETFSVRFKLWHPGYLLAPNVMLIDADSHEAELEIHSPGFHSQTKSLVIGRGLVIASAWKVLDRPVEWGQVLRELEILFVAPQLDVDLHTPEEFAATQTMIPPGYKTALIIGLAREEQFYLKARLSLQGISHVAEVGNAGNASELMGRQFFEIVILDAALPDADAPLLIQVLREHLHPPKAIIAVLDQANWEVLRMMEEQGVTAVLERPFIPAQVGEVFSRL